MTKFEDKTLTCEECGTEFVWDASEQAYFAKKGFKKIPKRCRACRAARKIEEEKEKKNWLSPRHDSFGGYYFSVAYIFYVHYDNVKAADYGNVYTT